MLLSVFRPLFDGNYLTRKSPDGSLSKERSGLLLIGSLKLTLLVSSRYSMGCFFATRLEVCIMQSGCQSKKKERDHYSPAAISLD
jgi:hypothetical protein